MNFFYKNLQQLLMRQGNKILSEFKNIQATKATEAKEKNLHHLYKSLLREVSFTLNTEEVSECEVENGWNIQILDGRENLLIGLADFCMTLSLFRGGEPIFSITYLPFFGESVICEDNVRLVSDMDMGIRKVSSSKDKIICAVNTDLKLPNIKARDIHCDFRAITLVALGRVDACILKLPEWAKKIAKFYITKAGGMVSSVGSYLIGSNSAMHEELREKVKASLADNACNHRTYDT